MWVNDNNLESTTTNTTLSIINTQPIIYFTVTQPLLKRAHVVLLRLQEMGIPLFCLAQTKLLQPKHPLYIRKGVKLQPYEYFYWTDINNFNNNNNNDDDAICV